MTLANHTNHSAFGPMSRRIRLAAALLAGAAGLASLTGCYQRVVEARGFGANRISVSEPYQESSAIDRFVFGDDAKPAR